MELVAPEDRNPGAAYPCNPWLVMCYADKSRLDHQSSRLACACVRAHRRHRVEVRSTVSLSVKGKRASARNIVAVMLLTASVGSTVRIEIDGPDEAEAMREIAALFHDGFGERS